MMGMLMCLVALSIDSILPALGAIDSAFALENDNARQWVVPALFIGFISGQIIFGPLGDRYGRKPMIWFGMAILAIGTAVSAFALSFEVLLIGRVIQGFGIAAARVLCVAIIRDRFVGKDMAQIMSLVIAIFLFAPIFAPSFGQAVLLIFPWQAVLWTTLAVGLIATGWLQLRQSETLAKPVPINVATLWQSLVAVLTSPVSLGYTLAGGAVYTGLMGYILSSQQLYQDIYQVGNLYPIIMGGAGAVVAVAMIANSKLVQHVPLPRLCLTSAFIKVIWTVSFLVLAQVVWNGLPPLWVLLVFIAGTQILLGLVFGNLASIALEPLGHIAGSATAIQSSLMTGIAISAATFIGSQLGDNLTPILLGYAVSAVGTFVFMFLAERYRGSKIET